MPRTSLALCSCPSGVVLAQTQSQDERSLGDAAREARERKIREPQVESAHTAKVRELIADMSVNTPEEYQGQISDLVNRQDIEGLENAADTARSTKSRFPGGAWKLFFFYDTVSQPLAGRRGSDAAWTSRIAFLKYWIDHRPQSSTARITLAQAYLYYGAKARGRGYADTVTDEGWQAYGANAAWP